MKHTLIFSSAYAFAAMEQGKYSEEFSLKDGTLSLAGQNIEVECKTSFDFKIKRRQFKTLKSTLKRIPEQPIVLKAENTWNEDISLSISFEF